MQFVLSNRLRAGTKFQCTMIAIDMECIAIECRWTIMRTKNSLFEKCFHIIREENGNVRRTTQRDERKNEDQANCRVFHHRADKILFVVVRSTNGVQFKVSFEPALRYLNGNWRSCRDEILSSFDSTGQSRKSFLCQSLWMYTLVVCILWSLFLFPSNRYTYRWDRIPCESYDSLQRLRTKERSVSMHATYILITVLCGTVVWTSVLSAWIHLWTWSTSFCVCCWMSAW